MSALSLFLVTLSCPRLAMMSEKSSLNQTISLKDQHEEMEKIDLKNDRQPPPHNMADSGAPENYLHSVNYQSFQSDPNRYHSSRSFGTNASYLHSAPMSSHPSSDCFHTGFTSPPYLSTQTPPPYYNMPLKEIGHESRRRLGLYLDPELVNVQNWKSLADELGYPYMEVRA